MGGASNGSGNTVPSPEQVLEVFQGEKCGPAQVTDEIRRLAVLLDQVPTFEEHQKRSADAYRGWQMLLDSLLDHLRKINEELASAPPVASPREAAQQDEYRKLCRLRAALKGAADTSFIFGGKVLSPATRWSHAGALIATGVIEVLEQSGAGPLGFSAPGPVCRVTAKLVSRFTSFGEKSANAISLLLRGHKKAATNNLDLSGNDAES